MIYKFLLLFLKNFIKKDYSIESVLKRYGFDYSLFDRSVASLIYNIIIDRAVNKEHLHFLNDPKFNIDQMLSINSAIYDNIDIRVIAYSQLKSNEMDYMVNSINNNIYRIEKYQKERYLEIVKWRFNNIGLDISKYKLIEHIALVDHIIKTGSFHEIPFCVLKSLPEWFEEKNKNNVFTK